MYLKTRQFFFNHGNIDSEKNGNLNFIVFIEHNIIFIWAATESQNRPIPLNFNESTDNLYIFSNSSILQIKHTHTSFI